LAQVETYQKEIIEIFRTEFRNLKEKEHFYTNTNTVTRLCIAREFDREKIIEMWRNWIKWYEDYRPDLIS
jgi:hypothetical protein